MPTSGVYHLKWDQHMQNIASLFSDLFSSENLTDVTISCRDGSLHAHKLVLSACSPYFAELFRKTPQTSHPIFIMHGITFQNMQILLEFMYKGVIDVPEHLVSDLLAIAANLEIKGFYVNEDVSQKKTQSHGNQSPVAATGPPFLKKRKLDTPDVVLNGSHVMDTPIQSRDSLAPNTSEGRQTRFKGKKRVPVGEVSRDDLEILRTSPKKKLPKPSSSDGFINNFVIRDISGGNGSIILSVAPKTHTPPLPTSIHHMTPEDHQDLLQVTPVITISEPEQEKEQNYIPEIQTIHDDDDQPMVDSNEGIEDGADPEYSMRTEEDSASHMYNHKLTKPFRCEFCRAHMPVNRFARASHLARHRRMHTGERPFSCKLCDKKFARQDKLKLHLRSHHDDTDYIPKSEKHARLFGTPIETIPENPNSSSVTQSIIQSVNAINSPDTSPRVLMKKRRRGRPRTREIRVNQERRPRGRPRKIKPKPEQGTTEDNYDITTLPYGDFSYLTSELTPHLTVSEPSTLYESVPIETMTSFDNGNITISQVNTESVPPVQPEQRLPVHRADDLLQSIRLIGECTIRPVT